MFVLTNLTQTFLMKKTEANMRQVTSYLVPKPGLKLFLKLKPFARKQTRSLPCCPQQVSEHWHRERITQQLHPAHNNWARVLSNVAFLICIPYWKSNATPQHVSRKKKKKRKQILTRHEGGGRKRNASSAPSCHRTGSPSRRVCTEGTETNLPGAHMKRGLT